jgi:cytochrome P450
MASDLLPPGPRAPAVAQTLRYLSDPLGLMQSCTARYGDVFTIALAGIGDLVLVSSPEHVKTLLTAPPDVLYAGEATHKVFGPICGEHTAFVLDGAEHLERRRLLLPAFHGDRVHAYGATMRTTTERVIARWRPGRPFPLLRQMHDITLQVILGSVFGVEELAADAPMARVLADLAEEAMASPLLVFRALRWDLGPTSPWGRVLDAIARADALIFAEIARRRQRARGDDILSLLLALRDEHGRALDDVEIRDELVATLLAGHETTGTALTWALESILSRPAVLSRLLAEIRALGLDRVGVVPAPAELAQLPYLDAVIRETLRLRPIMAVGGTRILKAPFAIGGYTLPAGTYLASCVPELHRRAELYPDPDAFVPERFLERKPGPYEFSPFGGGVRRCLGMAFALYELKVVLITVLTRARLELACDNVRARARGFFLAPEAGLPVSLVRA